MKKAVCMSLLTLLAGVVVFSACGPPASPPATSPPALPPATSPPAAAQPPVQRTEKPKTAIPTAPPVQRTEKPKPTTAIPPAKKPPWPDRVSILGSSAGGGGHRVATAVGVMIDKYISGVKATAEPSSGPTESLRLLGQKQGQLSFGGFAIQTYWAVRGIEQGGFKEKVPLRMLFSGPEAAVHIYALEKSDIKTIAEFKGKKIAGGIVGSMTNETARQQILGAYGLSDNDIRNFTVRTDLEVNNMIKDGIVDGVLRTHAVPAPALTELATTQKLRWLSLDLAAVEKVEKQGLWRRFTIKAGTYPSQDKDLLTLGDAQCFVASPELDEGLVYEIVKAVYEHRDEFESMEPFAKQWTLNRAVFAFPAPYHPGAIKYYKEKGLWTAEMEKRQQELLAEIGK